MAQTFDPRMFGRNNPYAPLIQYYVDSLGAAENDFSSALSGLLLDHQAAQQQEATAFRTLQEKRNEPMPEVPAEEQWAHKLTGGVAGVLQRSEAPMQRAQGDINFKRQQLNQQRQDTISGLEQSYTKAAARAEKLGDLDLQMKYQTKLNTLQSQREKLMEAGAGAAEHESRMKLQALQNKGAKDAAGARSNRAAAAKNYYTTKGQYRQYLADIKKRTDATVGDTELEDDEKFQKLSSLSAEAKEYYIGAGRLQDETDPFTMFRRLRSAARPGATMQKGGWFGERKMLKFNDASAVFTPEEAAWEAIRAFGLDDAEEKEGALRFLLRVGKSGLLGDETESKTTVARMRAALEL